jgi:NMD protein affecting ribosome stability and mRNA decay
METQQIEIDQDRLEELRVWMSKNEEIRHCHSCNYHYHEDNWVENKYGEWVCQECGSNYKNSELIETKL